MLLKLFVLFAAVISCVYAERTDKFYFQDHKFDRTELGDAIDRASMSFLKEAYESAAGKNLVASPLGVFTLLTLYAGGAGPQAKDEIVRVLGASNYSELSDSYGALGSKLASINSRFFTIANKIYLSNEYTLEPGFKSLVTRSHGEVEKISFADAKAATDIINQWGEEKTRGNIKKPVPENAITLGTKLALFDIIYFQDQWNVPFDAEETKEEDFYLNRTTTVKKLMMHLLKPLFYYESDDIEAKLIELPYKLKGFRMVIVVPNEVDGLSSVIDKVQRKGLLADVFELRPAHAEIDLYLPKFDIDSEFDLNEILPKMGIEKIFSEDATGIARESGVVVSKAFQKAFVKVDEEGSTAGAFTGVILVPLSTIAKPPPPIEVRVNRPFLFAILDEDKILFIGTYSY